MSPTLNVNFDEVPDQILPVEPGIYEAEIVEVPMITETRKKTGHNLVVSMRITTDGPHHGRALRDSIFLNDIGNVKIKKLCSSAGVLLGSGGFETEELLGKIVRCQVLNRTFTDSETGETRQIADVRDYLKNS